MSDLRVHANSGVVFYRFKHNAALGRIEFGADQISLAELRIKIAEKVAENPSYLHVVKVNPDGSLGDLCIHDGELLDSNVAVVVFRAPNYQVVLKELGRLEENPNRTVSQTRILSTQASGGAGESGPGAYSIFSANPGLGKSSRHREEQKLTSAYDGKVVDSEDATKPLIPWLACCPLCYSLMAGDLRAPLTLQCCQRTVCRACAKESLECPSTHGVCKDSSNAAVNLFVVKFVDMILAFRLDFEIPDGCEVPEIWHTDPNAVRDVAKEEAAADVHEIDDEQLDVLDDDVVDLDEVDNEVLSSRLEKDRALRSHAKGAAAGSKTIDLMKRERIEAVKSENARLDTESTLSTTRRKLDAKELAKLIG